MKKFRFYVSLFILPLLLVLATGQNSHAAKQGYQKTMAEYQPPDVTLTNQNGESIPLMEYLTTDKPVMLEFIFVTCTTICPVMSVGFTNLQRRLGENSAKVRLVSVSIDPEYDTPPVMKKYLERYNAKPGWDFLTGSKEDIYQVMRAFNAYVADKMNHMPLYFMRSPKQGQWTRVNGLLGGKDMMHEYQTLIQ